MTFIHINEIKLEIKFSEQNRWNIVRVDLRIWEISGRPKLTRAAFGYGPNRIHGKSLRKLTNKHKTEPKLNSNENKKKFN